MARLNEKQPADLYEAVFYKLLHRCKQQPSSHKFRFKNPLYSLDASAIELSLKLFPWAAHRVDTANVKLSVGLNHGSMLPEFVALSDGNESDMIQGRKFEFPKGSIVAFDKVAHISPCEPNGLSDGLLTDGLMMVMPWIPCIPCANFHWGYMT